MRRFLLVLAMLLVLPAQTRWERAGRRVAPPVPMQVSGLRNWWVAAQSDGTSVTDRVGRVDLVKAAGAAAPGILAPCFELGGRPCVKFYQDDSEYATMPDTGDADFLSYSSGSSGFLRFVQQRGGGVILSNFGSSTANGSGILIYVDGSDNINLYVSRGGSLLGAYISGVEISLTYNVPHTLSWKVDPVANKLVVRWDGTQVNNSAINAFTGTPASYPLRLGMYSGPPNNNPYGGLVSDLLLYDRALTTAEFANIEGWLAAQSEPPAAFYRDTGPLVRAACTGAVKVMFVGDSICEGKTTTSNLEGGFRQVVNNLVAQKAPGFTIDHVGPYANAFADAGGFDDNNSDCKGGAVIQGVVGALGHYPGSNVLSGGDLPTNVTTYQPDVIVMMLGTNSLSLTPANIYLHDNSGDWVRLVLLAHAARPSAVFVLTSITPRNPATASIPAFNRAIMSGINFLKDRGVQIIAVDSYSDLSDPATMLGDAVHPNDAGSLAIGLGVYRGLVWACGISDGGI